MATENDGQTDTGSPSFCEIMQKYAEIKEDDTKTQNDGETDTESPSFCLNPLLNPCLLAPPNLETFSHKIGQFISFFNNW